MPTKRFDAPKAFRYVVTQLNYIIARLARIERRQRLIMREIRIGEIMSQQDIDKLKAAVEKSTSVSQSAVTLIQGLAQQIRDAADDPEELAALAQQLEAQSTALASAVSANTPDSQPQA